MQKQKDAVFAHVESVVGTITGQVTLTKDQRHEVIAAITQAIQLGTVEFSTEAKAKYDTTEKVRTYVGGLVNNWLRKDPRLNGNTKYQAANPGSRTNSGDEQLKALKQLRKQIAQSGDTTKLAEVDTAITNRQAELKAAKPTKAKTVKLQQPQVDLSDVPDELKEALGL